MNFFLRWLVNAAGFFAALAIVPGITPTSQATWDVIAIVLVAGLINTVLGPVLKFVTFPIIFLTLGLWLLCLNMILFWFAGQLGQELGFGFTVSGFLPTFFGAIIVSVVSTLFGFVLSRRQ